MSQVVVERVAFGIKHKFRNRWSSVPKHITPVYTIQENKIKILSGQAAISNVTLPA
jgi:hypothetical protein